jgi:hypothetical protein
MVDRVTGNMRENHLETDRREKAQKEKIRCGKGSPPPRSSFGCDGRIHARNPRQAQTAAEA